MPEGEEPSVEEESHHEGLSDVDGTEEDEELASVKSVSCYPTEEAKEEGDGSDSVGQSH